MSYVDAGYAIVLVALALYSLSLLLRRRRLERAAERLGAGSPSGTPTSVGSVHDAGR